MMAVKSVFPRDVYGICMTCKKLKELKSFLIDLFSNPKMREAVPGSASVTSYLSVFSIGQHMENSVVNPTAVDKGKIQQDTNAIQVRFNKMSTADPRNTSNNKPWKPEVTPPRKRGGFNRGRGGIQFDNMQRNVRSKNNDSNGGQNGKNGQRNGNGNFRNEDKVKEMIEVPSVVEVEDEVGSIKVQMSDAQE